MEQFDMSQLTVRGFDDELSAAVRRLAKCDGISLNQAVLKLIRKGAGTQRRQGRRGRGRRFLGTSDRVLDCGGSRRDERRVAGTRRRRPARWVQLTPR